MKKNVVILAMLLPLISQAQSNSCPDDHHPHMIDLGLDDGTLWACCNVGASVPEEDGFYFAWGETTPKSYYYWDSYKWCEGTGQSLTKYNNDENLGTVDDRLELELEDDAAFVNWGAKWHMPSIKQVDNLFAGTMREQTVVNGVKGFLFTGKNGNTLFLPNVACMMYEAASEDSRSYWTRTLGIDETDAQYGVKFTCTDNGGHMTCYYDRWRGYPVRPVVLVPAEEDVLLDAAYFPDENFRKALAAKFDISPDGIDGISAEALAATSILSISNKAISSLAGIELFPNLERLYCSSNQLTSVDLSKNPNLSHLDISENRLASLDASGNKLLTRMNCSDNSLTSLEVSACKDFSLLDCSYNNLAELNVLGNRDLDWLYCSNNQLSELDVSGCWHLRSLDCNNNNLTSIQGLPRSYRFLVTVSCYHNQIKGSSMDKLISELWTGGLDGYKEIYVVDTTDEHEGNVCTASNVATAQDRGWVVFDYHGGDILEYKGYDPTGISEIFPDNAASDVYDMKGRVVRSKATTLSGLPHGVYIVNGKKVVR